ncbi:MAG: hypothetical protein ACXVEE_16740 [Polyangiales bacterium]
MALSFVRYAGSLAIAVSAIAACGPSTFRLRPATEDSAPVVARPVTIVRKPLEAGTTTRISESVSIELRLTFHAAGKPARATDLHIASKVVKEETALAAKAGESIALRVSYADVFSEMTVGGKSRHADSPLSHHTYVLRVVSGTLDALHPDGTAPSTEETKALRAAYRALTLKPKGAPKSASQASEAAPEIDVGKRLPEWEQRFENLLGVNAIEGVKTGDVQVTLLGVREGANDKAVFEVGVATDVDTKEKAPLHLHTLLRGRWVVGTETGWNDQLLLGGPTTVSGTVEGGSVEGSGTTRVLSTWEYLPTHA